MAELVDGFWLQQYVEPQLLEEFRNFKDDFIGVLERAPKAAIDTDGIRFNKLINNVGFHINRQTDFTPQKMEGKKTLVEWDKLDTDPTFYTDAELRALAFDKKAQIRVKHTESFKIGVRDYVMQKLAPERDVTGKTPILKTTGPVVDGRKRLTYEDLIRFLTACETLNLPNKKAWYLIINDLHRADLMIDKAGTSNHRDNLEFDKETGELKRFYKLRLFENNQAPVYDGTGVLKAPKAVADTGDQKASIFFYAPNTVYHIESVKVLAKPMIQDTRSADPTGEMRLHTYGLCDKKQDYGFGAILSANG